MNKQLLKKIQTSFNYDNKQMADYLGLTKKKIAEFHSGKSKIPQYVVDDLVFILKLKKTSALIKLSKIAERDMSSCLFPK